MIHKNKIEKFLFWAALAFVIYMPLHVLIVQSASLLTGGINVWKSAKDVILLLIVPVLLFVVYRNKLYEDAFFRLFITLSAAYSVLHVAFLLIGSGQGAMAAIVGSVYSNRTLAFLLLGYVVSSYSRESSTRYTKIITTCALLIGVVVATFGVAQYFLPKDLLESVGYSVERGVKPFFFIDDKPDFPRVMSTIKDPNSLGAYLIIPTLLSAVALFKSSYNKLLFTRPFRRGVLVVFTVILLVCQLLSFSRGALLALIVSCLVMFLSLYGDKTLIIIKKKWVIVALFIILAGYSSYMLKDTYAFKNIVFHADESTTKADPNEQRIILYKRTIDKSRDNIIGYGPGSAGIVSVKSNKGQQLTENYYLQVLYSTGILGFTLFMSITTLVAFRLYRIYRNNMFATIVFASMFAYLFYGLLVHIWSNEAVALQWWLLAGLAIGQSSVVKIRDTES